jgi:hypothetical protein
MNPETRRADKPVALVGIENNKFTYVDMFFPEWVPEP